MTSKEEKEQIRLLIYSMLPQYDKLCSEVTPEFDNVINVYVDSTHSLVDLLRRSMDTLIETKSLSNPTVSKLMREMRNHIVENLV